jgi:hypothetical protein
VPSSATLAFAHAHASSHDPTNAIPARLLQNATLRALQLADLLRENELTKSEMAARALGRKVKIELVPS